MKVARIPAKLKVSSMDQYCPRIAVFFYEVGHGHFSLCLHFKFYDNCMIFALWSFGLQHHVVLGGI